MQINDGRVVSNFIVQALKGKDITLYGDGNQTRSFCFIDDMINGLVSMMNSKDSIIGPINLGNPHEITIKELATTIINLTKSKSKLIYQYLPSDDPRQRCPNINKAKSILDWSPKIDLEIGLAKTINYFEKVLKSE